MYLTLVICILFRILMVIVNLFCDCFLFFKIKSVFISTLLYKRLREDKLLKKVNNLVRIYNCNVHEATQRFICLLLSV